MYKLAVVPKVHYFDQYSRAYGSHHDYKHIKKCIKKAIGVRGISSEIIYEGSRFSLPFFPKNNFTSKSKNFDGVIYIGISSEGKKFIKDDDNIDKFLWSFNQF